MNGLLLESAVLRTRTAFPVGTIIVVSDVIDVVISDVIDVVVGDVVVDDVVVGDVVVGDVGT